MLRAVPVLVRYLLNCNGCLCCVFVVSFTESVYCLYDASSMHCLSSVSSVTTLALKARVLQMWRTT